MVRQGDYTGQRLHVLRGAWDVLHGLMVKDGPLMVDGWLMMVVSGFRVAVSGWD